MTAWGSSYIIGGRTATSSVRFTQNLTRIKQKSILYSVLIHSVGSFEFITLRLLDYRQSKVSAKKKKAMNIDLKFRHYSDKCSALSPALSAPSYCTNLIFPSHLLGLHYEILRYVPQWMCAAAHRNITNIN